MPGDSFAFAVRVGGEENPVFVGLGEFTQFRDDFFLRGVDDVDRGEVTLDINPVDFEFALV